MLEAIFLWILHTAEDEFGAIGTGINRMSQDLAALIQKRIQDEKERKDLEYRILQSQINPHFLYNTLNSIKWMATIRRIRYQRDDYGSGPAIKKHFQGFP